MNTVSAQSCAGNMINTAAALVVALAIAVLVSTQTVQGCNSLTVGGLAQPLRGHTSQFYNAGLDNSKSGEFALEGAYLFLRSAYGDVTVGARRRRGLFILARRTDAYGGKRVQLAC